MRVLDVALLVDLEVAQPEVGAEVDDLDPALEQRGDDRRRRAVRVGDDRGVDVAVAVEVELLEHGGDAVVRVEVGRAAGPRRCAR